MPFRTYARCIAMMVTLSLVGLSSLPALAGTTDSGAIVQIKVDDLRQVTIYTEALEAENATLKQSLESERTAVTDLLSAQEQERQAQAEYVKALNNELKQEKKKSTIKNCLLVALAAGVVALAVSR